MTVEKIEPMLDDKKEPINTVCIYPKGKMVRLIFNSKSEKERYIKHEYRFCRDEEDVYLAARFKGQRERTKELMYDKRVLFAQQRGFIPKIGNKDVWVLDSKPEPKVAA